MFDFIVTLLKAALSPAFREERAALNDRMHGHEFAWVEADEIYACPCGMSDGTYARSVTPYTLNLFTPLCPGPKLSPAGDPKFLGNAVIYTDPAVKVSPPAERIEFLAYEGTGLTAYAFDRGPGGTPDIASCRPLRNRDDLKPGMELLFKLGFGEYGRYWLATVDPDLRHVSGEQVFGSLRYDEGRPEADIPAEWVGDAFGNAAALSRVEFE